jgi:aminoglycoside phosphotransferase (APT) family kinase protein
MIFDAASPRMLAVLDWELSTIGHPFADLAYQCMQWRLPNGGTMRGLAGIDRQALGIPTEAAYVASYEARTGADVRQHWTFYLAFSFFRLAAILQGVLKRALSGNASNPEKGLRMGERVPLLASMALAAINSPDRTA